jgi:hypothetical protein
LLLVIYYPKATGSALPLLYLAMDYCDYYTSLFPRTKQPQYKLRLFLKQSFAATYISACAEIILLSAPLFLRINDPSL